MLSINLIKQELIDKGLEITNTGKEKESYYNCSSNCLKIRKECLKQFNSIKHQKISIDTIQECTNKELIYHRNNNKIYKVVLNNKKYILKSLSYYPDYTFYNEVLCLSLLNSLKKIKKYNTPKIYSYGVTNDPKTCLILMSDIHKSYTFNCFISNISDEVFVKTLLKIAIVLYYIYTKIGIIHFDLHANNVLIREFKEEINVNYGEYNISDTKTLPCFIDFSFSSCISSGKHFFYDDKTKFNNLVNNPITDIYKLIISSYRVKKSKKECSISYDVFNNIFKFFTTENIEDHHNFNKENNYYCNIPKYYKESGEVKLKEFIDFLINM